MAKKVSRRAIAAVVADRLIAKPADGAVIMRETAAYLIDNDMVDSADVLMNDIAEALFERGGHLSVEVTTAHALTAEARTRLTNYLQAKTQAGTVDVFETVEPELVGGFIAKTASSELDASIRRQLQQLRAIA